MKESEIRARAIKELIKEGWVVWYPPKVKYHSTDIWGVFDLIAVRCSELLFIQLTTVPNIAARRKKINKFLRDSGAKVRWEIWAWDKKRGGFR